MKESSHTSAGPRAAGADGGPDPLRFLVGPTASGKTALSLEVAERAGAEILSLDSMLVYRGLDVGTAKPDAAQRERVRHHLLDLVDPDQSFDVGDYVQAAGAALDELERRGRRGFFVGGTALYLKALTHGLLDAPPVDAALRSELEARGEREGPGALHAELRRVDPAAARRIHPNDAKRVQRALEVWLQTGEPLSARQTGWGWGSEQPAPGRPRRLAGLSIAVEELDRRIPERTRRMLDGGWVEEAVAVRDTVGFGPTAGQALGYAQVLRLAEGQLDRATAEREIALRTRQFARRQRTWLRKFPEIRWVAAPYDEDLAGRADEVLEVFGWSSLSR